MENRVKEGYAIRLKAPRQLKGGEAIVFGKLVGIALIDAEVGQEITFKFDGACYSLAKTNVAIRAYDKLQVDPATGLVAPLAADGVYVGFALEDATIGAKTVLVMQVIA